MTCSEKIAKLKAEKVVVVVRGRDKLEGLETAYACLNGGLKAIEVAFTNPQAVDIIASLHQTRKETGVYVGAGSVVDPHMASLAIQAGASYIVSPSFSEAVAQVCHLYAIPYLPGCMTVTEMTRALEAGCEMVKLFPASLFGQDYLSAIKAPLPQLSFMVTGGVQAANMAAWFQAGAAVVGVGGELNRLAEEKRFDEICSIATTYHRIAQEGR